MARNLEVYPKVTLIGSTWTLIVKVNSSSRFRHTIPANIVVTTPLRLLKFVLYVDVDDADTDQDVDNAVFVDDIHPSPQTEETVWSNWQAIAEGIIEGLTPGYTIEDFFAAWTEGDTQAMRNDIQRAFMTGPGGIGRGWTITGFHQHEGDGAEVDG